MWWILWIKNVSFIVLNFALYWLHLQMFWVDMSRILLNWVIIFFFIKGREPIELSRFEIKNTFKKHFELVLHASLMVE